MSAGDESAHADAAFGTFVRKWFDAHPEYAIAATFLRADQRVLASAFACLVHELEGAGHGREPQVAAAKLGWWRNELAALASRRANHPITRQLFADAAARSVDARLWPQLADAALQEMDPAPAATLDDLIRQHAGFFQVVSRIDAQLSGADDSDVEDNASLWTISRLLRDLPELQRAPERLPVPLDLLARHGMTRGDLSTASAKRKDLIRDQLDSLSGRLARMPAKLPASLGLYQRVRTRLDMKAIAASRKAADPLEAFSSHSRARRWQCLWISWREARDLARLR